MNESFVEKNDHLYPSLQPKAGLTDWFHLLTDPDEKRLAQLMKFGQLQTWPKIAMIRNRLRIENSIRLGRRHVRDSHKSTRQQNTSAIDRIKEQQHSSGDDAASGDEGRAMDEFKFLSGRRLSMPDNMGSAAPLEGRKVWKEEQRRLKFLAQFTDTSGLGTGTGQYASSSTGAHHTDDYLSDDESELGL